MNDVARHYDQLLAEHYSWMVGLPFDTKVAEQRLLLERLGLSCGAYGRAIDLGCGPGYQSVALAQLGYSPVLSIDSNQSLLSELEAQRGHLPIEAVHADIGQLLQLVPGGGADAIVCMGDTLTHLPGRAEVSKFLSDAYQVLAAKGVCVLTYRDLSIPLTGLDRILQVRADAERIMTCVLDYEADSVVVNDLVHVREENEWSLRKSCYRKLRLSSNDLCSELMTLGFAVQLSESIGGLHAIVASR